MRDSRPMIDLKLIVLLSAVLMSGFGPRIASAALGEPEASVTADVAQLKGSINVTDRSSYRVHEIQLSSGTVVREFVGLDGKVFAIAWKGPTIPNLRQILGQYFQNYVTAASAKHLGHNHLQIQQSDLVVQAGGHMRAFSGRAYLPQAVPGGVSVGDLH
jgi:Protein of unknown function (DUF2844)